MNGHSAAGTTPGSGRRLWLLLLAGMAGAVRAEGLPPVNLSGEISTTYRYTEPEQGEPTMQKIWTGEINANSYIWEPWMALWFARLGLSSVSLEDGQDIDSVLFTGEGRLRLFPQSRFPGEAFFNIQDTRVGVDDPLADLGDFRYTRMGVSQQYRAADGQSFVSGRLERSEQEDRSGLSDKQVDRFQANFNHTLSERQRVGGNLVVEQTSSPRSGDDEFAANASFTHNYRRDARLSVDSLANLVRRRSGVADGTSEESRLLMNSHTSWRPEQRPLTVTGNLLVLGEEREGGALGDSETFTVNLSGGASYELSEALRASGLLGANVRSGDSDAFTSFQNFGLAYTPPSREVMGFNYSWNANGAVRNTTGDDGDIWGLGSGIGHSANRLFRMGPDDVFLVSVDGSQNLGIDFASDDGTLYTLTQRGGLSVAYPAQSPTSHLRLTFVDARDFGRTDSTLDLLSGNLSSTLQLNRFSGLNAEVGFNATRVETGGESAATLSSSAGITYRHQRAFGIYGLRFSSELRFQSNSLLPIGFLGEEGDGWAWDNRLDYTIGRLDVRLRAVAVHVGDNGNVSLLLTVSRSF